MTATTTVVHGVANVVRTLAEIDSDILILLLSKCQQITEKVSRNEALNGRKKLASYRYANAHDLLSPR